MTDNALQNTTEKQLFAPSANQEKWLDTAISLETDEITLIAEGCGIDRSQWYRWLKEPGFIEWFNTTWDKRLKGHAWKLDTIGLKNAKRDFKYWEKMQQRVGNLQENPSKGVYIQQNFTEHAKNELKEFE